MSSAFEPIKLTSKNLKPCMQSIGKALLFSPFVILLFLCVAAGLNEIYEFLENRLLEVDFSVGSAVLLALTFYAMAVQVPAIFGSYAMYKTHHTMSVSSFHRGLVRNHYYVKMFFNYTIFGTLFSILFVVLSSVVLGDMSADNTVKSVPESAEKTAPTLYNYAAFIVSLSFMHACFISLSISEIIQIRVPLNEITTSVYARKGKALNVVVFVVGAVALSVFACLLHVYLNDVWVSVPLYFLGLLFTNMVWVYILFSGSFPKKEVKEVSVPSGKVADQAA